VGQGIAVRGLGGQGVEIVPALAADPLPGEGLRLVGWNRPGGTITEAIKGKPGPVQAHGSPSK
jgi:hypothetical protein